MHNGEALMAMDGKSEIKITPASTGGFIIATRNRIPGAGDDHIAACSTAQELARIVQLLFTTEARMEGEPADWPQATRDCRHGEARSAEAAAPTGQIFKLKNGDKVIDATTGFIGVVTERTNYLTGPNRYGVEAPDPHNGGIIQQYFDEDRLTVRIN